MLDDGAAFDGWRVVRRLHPGDMAVTYEVVRPPEPTRYALKLLYLTEPSFRERLRRVGRAQRELQHPNLVPVVDVVEVDDAPGIISLFVDGRELSAWSADHRELRDLLRAFRQVVEGLVAAHDQGLVHRNLKPEKILVDARDVPRIYDFMLGKVVVEGESAGVTQMGTTFGTPQYMAPEQFRGAADVDARADLFSLGCILYELVTGRRAFEGEGLMEIYRKVSVASYRPVADLRVDAPPALIRLIDDLLAPDAAARPASARAVAQRLDTDPTLRALLDLAPLDVSASATTPAPASARRSTGTTLSPPEDELAEPEGLLPADGLAPAPAPPPVAPEATTPAAPPARPRADPLHDPVAEPVWEAVLAVLLVALGVAGVALGVVLGGL